MKMKMILIFENEGDGIITETQKVFRFERE
jgi:hypothetical protein